MAQVMLESLGPWQGQAVAQDAMQDKRKHLGPADLQSWRTRRRKFTTSIQLAKAYEDESVMVSGPH